MSLKRLIRIIYLTLTILLGSVGTSWGADYEKGLAAYEGGDFATALREWSPLAEQGNAYAQNNLGTLYANGWGAPQDYKTAAKWYTLAAEQGVVDAQNILGFFYLNGRGVAQNYETAVKWYTLAAEQGQTGAQFNLAHGHP